MKRVNFLYEQRHSTFRETGSLLLFSQVEQVDPCSRSLVGENLVAGHRNRAIYNQFTQFPRHFRDASSEPGPKRAFREVT